MYLCPNCGSANDLEVVVSCRARLIQHPPVARSFHGQDGTQALVRLNEDTLHEWDHNSTMQCLVCGHTAKVGEFEDAPEAAEKETNENLPIH